MWQVQCVFLHSAAILVSGDHLSWSTAAVAMVWSLPWWRLQFHMRSGSNGVCGTCKWRFAAPQLKWRSAPTSLQLHGMNLKLWSSDCWLNCFIDDIELLDNWLIDCLYWLIDFIDWLTDWLNLNWWRLCTCVYPVLNSPTWGRHIWLIDCWGGGSVVAPNHWIITAAKIANTINIVHSICGYVFIEQESVIIIVPKMNHLILTLPNPSGEFI